MAELKSLAEKIEETIIRDIRPYIEMDGGKIRLVEIRDNVVYVELAGACGTCPSSTMTLRGGVERILKRQFPEIAGVELASMSPTFFTHP